jgi:hypothetical protein
MKRQGILLTAILLLSFFYLISIKPSSANWSDSFLSLPSVTIQRDGSILPMTDLINQVGDSYFVNNDLNQAFVIYINCSNIILDGQNHSINGTLPSDVVGYYQSALVIEDVYNVTVRDLSILNFTKYEGISIFNCSNVNLIGVQVESSLSSVVRITDSNYSIIRNSNLALVLEQSKYNNIFDSNISYLGLFDNSTGSLIYHNNIFGIDYGVHYTKESGYCPLNQWDNGSIGNYWSNYGGNDQYIIDGANVDHHPLTQQVTIVLTEPAPTPYLPPRNPPHAELIDYLLPISVIVTIVIVLFVLLYRTYRKKR